MEEPYWLPRTAEEYLQQVAEDSGPQPDETVLLQRDIDAAEAEVARLQALLAERDAEVARLREALESSRRTHLDVDGDPWFSCPKSEDRGGSCLRHDMDGPCPCGCTCGADEHNARIDAALVAANRRGDG